MIEKLLEILKSGENLIDLALKDTVSMLKTSSEMFNLVVDSIDKTGNDTLVKTGVAKVDKLINEKQKSVRKMVYEHLAISGAKDLPKSIELFSIINNIERIGDYAKNLAEVLDYASNESVRESQYFARYDKIVTETKEMFAKMLTAFEANNFNDVSEVSVQYIGIATSCNQLIEDIIINSSGDSIKKVDARMVLMLRYTKRINAHLRNVSITIKNPIVSIAD